jgi:hypothetical protein
VLLDTPGQLEGEPASTEKFLELREGKEDEGDEEGDQDQDQDVDERAWDEINDTQEANGSSGASNTPAANMRYPAQSMKPKSRHDTQYYENINRYLRIKEHSLMYELKDGALFDKDTGIRVVMELEMFEEIVEAIHKDLGHYGKKTTLDAVADR